MSDTGDALSAALERLEELPSLEVHDHVEVYEAVHTAMRQELADDP